MAGLSALTPGGPNSPIASPLQRANPTAGNEVLSSAVSNLYSDAAMLNPQDGFVQNFIANTPSAAELTALKAQAYSAQQDMRNLQQKYMQDLQYFSSPERASQLNWQALGQMGAAMMQPASDAQPGGQTQWSRGAQAYMDARVENQKALDTATQELSKVGYGFGKENAAAAMANYKLAEDTRRANMKEAGDLYEKLLGRQSSNRVVVKDSTGREILIDKNDPSFRRVLTSSSGLTGEQTTQLGQYYIHLLENVPDGPNKQAIVTQEYKKKLQELQSLNQGLQGLQGPSFEFAPGTSDEEKQQIIEAGLADFTKNGAGTAPAATETGAVPTENSFFSAEDLKGYSPTATANPSKMDTEAWKLRLARASKQAEDELATATSNLSQANAVLESSRAALSTGANTGQLQDYINILGNFAEFVGAKGPIVEQAIKGATFETLANGAVQILQNAAKGVQTEGDALRFKQSLVNIKNPAEANKLILKYMEAVQYKRQLEVEYRHLYGAANSDPSGAGYKWSNIAKTIPLTKETPAGVVYMSDFINGYMQSVDGATEAQALSAWRKKVKGK